MKDLPQTLTGRRCGARSRTTGLPCRQWPLVGAKRCRFHGGNWLRDQKPARTVYAATREGLARYRERMALAKKLGIIDRHPWGEQPGTPKLVAKAKAVIERVRSEMSTTGSSAIGERLTSLLGKSLDTLEAILDYVPPEGADAPDPLKVMSLKRETAATVLNTQIKVNVMALQARQANRLAPVLEKLFASERALQDITPPQGPPAAAKRDRKK